MVNAVVIMARRRKAASKAKAAQINQRERNKKNEVDKNHFPCDKVNGILNASMCPNNIGESEESNLSQDISLSESHTPLSETQSDNCVSDVGSGSNPLLTIKNCSTATVSTEIVHKKFGKFRCLLESAENCESMDSVKSEDSVKNCVTDCTTEVKNSCVNALLHPQTPPDCVDNTEQCDLKDNKELAKREFRNRAGSTDTTESESSSVSSLGSRRCTRPRLNLMKGISKEEFCADLEEMQIDEISINCNVNDTILSSNVESIEVENDTECQRDVENCESEDTIVCVLSEKENCISPKCEDKLLEGDFSEKEMDDKSVSPLVCDNKLNSRGGCGSVVSPSSSPVPFMNSHNLGCLESDSCKPVKVKSRWRRSSELEMVSKNSDSDLGLTPPSMSPKLIPPIPKLEPIAENKENNMEIVNCDPVKCEVEVEVKKDPVKVEKNEKEEDSMEEKLRTFDPIDENVYLTERTRSKEAKRMICDCFLTKEEIVRGEMGCGEDCLNRLLMIECGSRCPVGERCSNKRFQKREYGKCEIFKTEKKGFGLKALEDLSVGSFLMEYVGQVLDPKEFRRRAKDYSKMKNRHYYFMALKSDAIIDATLKGNFSRFINHSCDPNAETQKWTVNGELRIGFFCKKPIHAGEEVTFDYQFQRYGKEAQRCHCETSICRGWIGEDPEKEKREKKERKEREAKKRKEERRREVRDFFEDMDLEEEIEKLCASGLKNRTHTLTLCRLMVRAEDQQSRIQLLKLLQEGEPACRRLFLDYHGLRLIWSWMMDMGSSSDNFSLKMEILETLSRLPIPNKTMLQDSKVISVVEKWVSSPLSLIDGLSSDSMSDAACEGGTPRREIDRGCRKERSSVDDESGSDMEFAKQDGLKSTGPRTDPIKPDVEMPDEESMPGIESEKQVVDYHSEEPVSKSSEKFVSVDESDNTDVENQSGDNSVNNIPLPGPRKDSESKFGFAGAKSGELEGVTSESDADTKTPSKQEGEESDVVADGDKLEVVKMELESETSNAEESDARERTESDTSRVFLDFATRLLDGWSTLKEVFRIPKKERIEQMKEHEREADRGYKEYLDKGGNHGKQSYDRSWRHRTDYDKKERKRSRESPDHERARKGPRLEDKCVPLGPKMSKEERRQLFALKVAQEEEERRQQQEIWRQYEEQCLAVGVDPQMTTAIDPNTGYPCFYDPSTGSWQAFPDPNGLPPNGIPPNGIPPGGLPPEMGPPPVYDPTNPHSPHMGGPQGGNPLLGSLPPGYEPNTASLPPPPYDPNRPPLIHPPPPLPAQPYPTDRPPMSQESILPPEYIPVPNMPPPGYEPHNTQPPCYPSESPHPPLPPQPYGSAPLPSYDPQQQPPTFPPPPQGQTPTFPAPPTPTYSGPPPLPSQQHIPPSVYTQADQPTIQYPTAAITHPIVLPGQPFDPNAPHVQPVPTPMSPQQRPWGEGQLPPTLEVAPPPLPDQPPVRLPPKWKSAKDAEGRVYYYHVKTRVSQWEPPAWEESANPDESDSSNDSSEEEEEEEEEEEDEDEEEDYEVGEEEEEEESTSLEDEDDEEKEEEEEGEATKEYDEDLEEGEIRDERRKLGSEEKSKDNDMCTTREELRRELDKKLISREKRREGLVQQHLISPRREQDREDLRKFREIKEKLRKQKELSRAKEKEEREKKRKEKHELKKPDKHLLKLEKPLFAAADTSSDMARKIKDQFRLNMAGVIVQYLNQYRKPDCKVGRIVNTEDFKHLARKLTHFVMVKELKHCRNVEDLECNDNVKHKARDFVKKYMMKFGPVYRRPERDDN